MFICIKPTKACQDRKIKFLIKTSINIKVLFHTTKIITKMSKQISAVTKIIDSLKTFNEHAVYRFNKHAI